MIPPVGAIIENSVTKLAQWGSSMVATKMQVAKMGKPSRRESQFKIRNKQSCGFVWRKVFLFSHVITQIVL